MSHLIDFGTAAILLFGAFLILVRARYFCQYGKEALATAGVYVLILGTLRAVRVAFPDLISTDDARVFTGLVAATFLGLQVINMVQAEIMLRYRKQLAIKETP